ncbi:MAG: hypothetical protein HQK86_04075 [Nitrospinae bacterium]|nr:hypothetical protein [Nitrospinota bacterium]MBF0633673.1 hypothetical protein [Nitrospinota bacterium]
MSEYFRNGQNGAAAYAIAKPGVKPGAAKVGACNLLKRPEIQSAIQERMATYRETSAVAEAITRDQLTKDARRLMEKAEEAGNYQAALKSVDTQAKLYGFYETNDAKGYEGYLNLIKKLSVVKIDNVNLLLEK